MKGCVRGYGNYEELTSSGVDPTELFDDIEDSIKSPDLMEADIVVEEYDDAVEETVQQDIRSPDRVHLVPVEKEARRRVRSKHSESDADPTVNLMLEGGSIYTAPSMFSLISQPNEFEDKKQIVKVTYSCFLFISLILHISIRLTECPRKRGHMELFLPRHTFCLLKKVPKVILQQQFF